MKFLTGVNTHNMQRTFAQIKSKTDRILIFRIAVRGLLKRLKVEPGFEGTNEEVEEMNNLFSFLDEQFNWNVDQDENLVPMRYFLRATSQEACEYLLNAIIPTLQGKKICTLQ